MENKKIIKYYPQIILPEATRFDFDYEAKYCEFVICAEKFRLHRPQLDG